MPIKYIIMIVCMSLGAWILLGEKSSVKDKITMIIAVIFLYFVYRYMTGSSIDEILAPLGKVFGK